jgi:hypothetical protein
MVGYGLIAGWDCAPAKLTDDPATTVANNNAKINKNTPERLLNSKGGLTNKKFNL